MNNLRVNNILLAKQVKQWWKIESLKQLCSQGIRITTREQNHKRGVAKSFLNKNDVRSAEPNIKSFAAHLLQKKAPWPYMHAKNTKLILIIDSI